MRYDLPPSLTVEEDGPLRIVTLNRPSAMNAADAALHTALADVWPQLAADPGASVVVLTGNGRAFSAGGDFDSMLAAQRDDAVRDQVFGEARRTVLGMLELPQPVIAAVNGPAVGLGASLVALSDLAVAADTAFLADPHLSVGLVPGDGAALVWPLLVGLMRAKQLVFTGDRIPAARALELGLVSSVVPAADVRKTAVELGHRLAALPQQALRDTRRLMNAPVLAAVTAVLDQAIAAERRSVTSPEHVEIIAGLVARRKQPAAESRVHRPSAAGGWASGDRGGAARGASP